MIKAAQAFLTGLFFAFILDFIFFLGIKLHYIDFLGIDLYFNTLFSDNQSPLIFFPLTALIGWLLIYWEAGRGKLIVSALLFATVSSALIPPIGYAIGNTLFRKTHVTLSIPPHTYRGDILYTDRDKLFYYDTDLQRMITLPKEKK